jgi:hypothetical protein
MFLRRNAGRREATQGTDAVSATYASMSADYGHAAFGYRIARN